MRKVCIEGKSHFFEGSNNHQIVVKYYGNSFPWGHHQIQTYYILPFLSVQCSSTVCWIWLRLISWSFLWQLGTASVLVSIISSAHWCFCWNWVLDEGWIYPYQTDSLLTPCQDLLRIIKEDVPSESACWMLPNATVIQYLS